MSTAFDGDAERELGGSEVRVFPFRLELIFETGVLLRGPGNGEGVVDVDGEDDGAERGATNVDAPFTWEAGKTPPVHSLVESLIPPTAGLEHTVYTFHQPHRPCLLAWGFEARTLFHARSLIVGQDAMEESGFDDEVLHMSA